MTRFFVRPEQIQEGAVTLDADDAHHLRTVLKASAGDPISVLDGQGLEYPGRLTEVGKTRAVARLETPFAPATEARTRITVAQALPKVGDKMEQVLQRGTEVGVAAFWAFESARSLTHLTADRQTKRLARWQTIVKTAAEQSHRALLPPVRADQDFGDVLRGAGTFDLALLAHPDKAETPLRGALDSHPDTRSVLVVIGPESGFTEAEAADARRAGVLPVSLGPRILRTETAALVAAAQILFALE